MNKTASNNDMEPMKNIVCLDGFTLNPGDNPWDAIEQLGNFVCYDRTLDGIEQTIERANNAHIILTNKTVINQQIIDQCPNLECIAVLATGYNVVDYQYAKEKGIVVLNVPQYGTDTVAEMTFAMIFRLARAIELNSQDVRENLGWTNNIDWTYWLNPQMELSGKTIGIVGFGNIGRRVGEIASVFKMNVLAYDKAYRVSPDYPHQCVELDELLAKSDIVSLHCPVFADTKNMINADKLTLMKNSAFLINTSRGQLVVEQDLANALNNGVISGAGLDTLQHEPPAENNPLLTAKNCVITPHIAWATLDARARIMATVADNVKCYLDGKLQNVINA
ncbi:D-2-hydroxyacid dehydrogenase [Vibrio sp. TH_r3]|uniref:D-2-hydroxyacid dehydrogenase n=1 Tax=Vibrio sp. TH_r3 TaxID=3082084 RepID=UPI0029545DDF|nr:D-2-hydroxyacid dehydrogenase [Vibrio sp. TH_r3]MDV7103386.1 D-2-hydroxyacid dehydrogenase [Vibrio sp. TH_r3]